MAIILILISFLVACNGVNITKLTAYNYHTEVGIPAAEEIWMEESRRVIGGAQVTSTSEHSHHAGIIATLKTGFTSICGGTLISKTRVLTAAHCYWDGVNQAKSFEVVLGSLTIFSGGTRITTTKILTHPYWNTNDITYDIAMVTIAAVEYSNSIQAIPLPPLTDAQQTFAGMTGKVSGYGKTSDAQNSYPSSTSLHHASFQILTNTVCQRSYDVTIHGSHLCTSGQGSVGTCDGDSGGPLTVVWKNSKTLVGVISFGFGSSCQAGYPSVYTRVTAFRTWIQANM